MLRFLADENFKGAIVRGVLSAKPDADIVRVQDTEMMGADDPSLLEWAAQTGRAVLTHDINTMIGYAYERVEAGLQMPGLFIVNTDTPIGEAVESIVLLIEGSLENEWEGQVRYIPLQW